MCVSGELDCLRFPLFLLESELALLRRPPGLVRFLFLFTCKPEIPN